MVKIVGAGPGAKDLITVRGMRMLNEADVIIYAGSLVNEELLEYDGSLYDDCELDELELLSSFFGTVSSGITTSSPYFARGSLLASMKTYPFSVS